MSCDVLVVDDDSQAGEEYARLIRESTRLQVVFTDNPESALEIIRSDPVKIAILDQRMGTTLGTQLFGRIREIDSRVRAVMFTGLADTSEVGEAVTRGYAAYLRKGEGEKLSVLEMGNYLPKLGVVPTRAMAETPAVILERKHGIPPWRKRVRYSLLSVELLDEEWVEPGSWTTIVSVQAGETQEYSLSHSTGVSFVIEEENQSRLASEFGFKFEEISSMTSALKAEVTERIKTTSTTQTSSSFSQKRNYQLPQEPADPNQLHVKSRRIERAPVFRRLRANVGVECSCCKMQNIVSILLKVDAGGVATRHVDTLSTGERRDTDTGIERW